MKHPAPIREAPSQLFDYAVGETIAAAAFSPKGYLIDSSRFPSEGNWAFCRFDSDEIPALRLGFQRGGFNGGFVAREPSSMYLQLHVELMTRDGAILWLPSGMYRADRIVSDPTRFDMRFDHGSQNILSMRGWPTIECHARSEDGELEVDIQFSLNTVTILPDSELPYCLFGMWESMGDARGSVRHGAQTHQVQGKVFFDHTRVLARSHTSIARHMYVYTTAYFEDGSGLFGYHSASADGRTIDDYCFYVYLDGKGGGMLLRDVSLTHLVLDSGGVAKGWKIACRASDFQLTLDISVRDIEIARCWGSPVAPQSRKQFSILPLVLDGIASVIEAGRPRTLRAYGLAEYFNAELWPADKAATESAAEAHVLAPEQSGELFPQAKGR